MEVLWCLRCRSFAICCLLVVSISPILLIEAHVRSQEVICNSIDIRNSVSFFKKLENCTVIEGFLRIVLIDNGTAKEYENLTFPALKEITGYLLLYRAAGMISVGNLFPNLVVIRGSVLFHNFALAIYEMNTLQEIGLHSLTDILRGSVKISKNYDLCYVDTIDWDLIAAAGKGGNTISENKNHCPDSCKSSCPTNPQCTKGKTPPAGDMNCKLCWGQTTCQKVCKECDKGERRIACTPLPSTCCARECLGGCTGIQTSDCLACRHFVYDGRCLESCPKNTFQYLGRRCITEEMCRNTTIKFDTGDTKKTMYYKPFNGSCLLECPPGYTESVEGNQRSCSKCKAKCPKTCQSIQVHSVSSAQALRGCTTIEGSLEIHIQGANIIKELEDNLKDIFEITHYLKVARSPSLLSLNFLKELRYIHGRTLYHGEYAFMVLDNRNLEDLWDWKLRRHPLEILNGTIFFHFNPKLCPKKIDALKNSTYAIVEKAWEDRDVSPNSNGDRVPCDVLNLVVKVISTSSEFVMLAWNNFREDIIDNRHLIGYVIYYREAPYKNVSIFDGRDGCNSDAADAWKVKDVNLDKKSPISERYVLTDLQPFTQYAYYVRAYMTSTAEKGAQSGIQFFMTDASTPSSPVKLEAKPLSNDEVVVQWGHPKRPNGIITNYTVTVTKKLDLPKIVFQRDYCDEVRSHIFKHSVGDHPKLNDSQFSKTGTVHQPGSTSSPDTVTGTSDNTSCPCDCKAKPIINQDEHEYDIEFEDFLHNNVFTKNPRFGDNKNTGRDRRSVKSDSGKTTLAPGPLAFNISTKESPINSSTTKSPINSSTTESPINSSVPTVDENKAIDQRIENVSGKITHRVVENLTHYTEYVIQVKACQRVDPSPTDLGCSLNAITTVRTLPLGGADDIPDDSVSLRMENGTARIKWDEPKNPNGLIVSYQIECRQEMSKPIIECISSEKYKESQGHHLTKLSPGNYSLRVRATSLAWSGNWTRPITFVVPATPSDSSLQVLWVIVPVILLVLCAFPVGGYYYFKHRFGIGVPDGILYASVNPEYMSAGRVYEPDEWEIPREKILMLRELGQGSFGMVYEGEGKDIQGLKFVKCAVKTVNEQASVRERIEFLQEASVMKAFNCHHVVKLLGVVSKGHPTLVVMELMAKGDLKSYLRSHRPDEKENEGRQPPTLREILQMAVEIADGMAYLAAKKFVHRDLAARNCMVAEDLTVKIGDFGMTRDIYETDYYRKGGKGLLPVRWMAPESLKDGVFTSQSDVWSYGVVLWEMATLASQPYQGLSNEQVLKYVINGGVMEKPENCPERLYALMKMCWHKNHRSRPTFSELIEVLLQDVSEHFREVSFYFTERPKMLASKEQEASLEVVTSSTPLKSPSALDCPSVNSRDNSDDDELDSIRYFPTSSTAFTNSSDIVQCANGVYSVEDEGPSLTAQLELNLGGNGRRHVYSNSEGSKGMSLPSSDGSKGSKVSSVSNGSLANGHAAVPFPSARTTTC